MNTYKSQIGNSPSETSIENNDNTSNINRLVSIEIIATNEPLIQLNQTNMIPSQNRLISHHEQQHIRIGSQEARQRRHQRQRRRRRERRAAPRRKQNQAAAAAAASTTTRTATRRLLEDYEFETIDTRQRWEQEQVNELEGFAVLEQLALIQDEIEQSHQIDTVQQLQEDEQQERNTEQLVHQELWEQIEFLHQQLNQR
ncbi:unnamed protein product [Rotaria sp. Silwood2]|nr:unnamed protein product [Rotaria sp. Silwood2]